MHIRCPHLPKCYQQSLSIYITSLTSLGQFNILKSFTFHQTYFVPFKFSHVMLYHINNTLAVIVACMLTYMHLRFANFSDFFHLFMHPFNLNNVGLLFLPIGCSLVFYPTSVENVSLVSKVTFSVWPLRSLFTQNNTLSLVLHPLAFPICHPISAMLFYVTLPVIAVF